MPHILTPIHKHHVMTFSKISEFLAELEKKLVEEIKEYEESKNVEELADISETLITKIITLNISNSHSKTDLSRHRFLN